MTKKRLDVLLVDQGLAPSRERARALILSGNVLVDDVPRDKAGTLVPQDARVTIRGEDHGYVSRGGLKLEGALDGFKVDPAGLDCLDAGASTGGFTDCLLQRGARSVIAVDVGYGQLAWKLRSDSRVTVIERTNVRHLKPGDLSRLSDLAVVDVSFISLILVLPPILDALKPGGRVLAMVKPQFEVGKGEVGKNGVVRDPEKQAAAVEKIAEFARNQGLSVEGPLPSPIPGPKGNREFFLYLKKAAP